jgi:hypothetical protein
MKTQVYSWRLSAATKDALEGEARRTGESLASLLDRIASEWLVARRAALAPEAQEQARMRAAAQPAIGAIAGGDPRRAERVRETLRRKLARRRAR